MVDPLKNVVLPGLLIFISVACIFYLHICHQKAPQIAELVNAFIQFDKMYPTIERKLVDLPILRMFGTVMAKLLFLSLFAVPFGAVFGVHLNDPWKASLAGFWLIPKPSNKPGFLLEYIAFGIKIFVLAFNYWTWNVVAAGIVFFAGMFFNVGTMTILDFIDM